MRQTLCIFVCGSSDDSTIISINDANLTISEIIVYKKKFNLCFLISQFAKRQISSFLLFQKLKKKILFICFFLL